MSPTPTDPNQAQAWISGEAPDQTIDFYIPRGNTGIMGPQGPIGPSLSVGTIETVSGPAAPGTVGATGLTGPKGDPGGIVAGTILTGASDLNAILTDGISRWAAVVPVNAPNTNVNYGTLYTNTTANNTVINQMVFTASAVGGSRSIFVRSRDGATWSSWRSINTTRVDQTAGRTIHQWDDLNQREQRIYGDTGWRDITSLLTAAMVPASLAPKFALRRFGDRVTLVARISPAAATIGTARNNGVTLINPLPAGFVASNNHGYVMSGTGCVDSPFKCIVQVGALAALNQIMMYGSNTGLWASGEVVLISADWVTDDLWPTTLPGAAVGSIPNT